MCTSFTEHVRDFGPECDPAGCVLPKLEQILRRRMRRRNLLGAPPGYLGYSDVATWDSPGAFEDILVDCYVFAFLRRLQGLRNHLRLKPNIDGLVSLNVDRFLIERQRQNDPIGYSVFGNVEAAATNLIVSGEMTVEGTSEGRLLGTSVIRLRPTEPIGEPADLETLRRALSAAPGWGGILPDLMCTSEAGQAWVGGFFHRLRAEGILAVRVTDLVSSLADRAREEWKARNAVPASELGIEGDEDFGVIVRLVWPEPQTHEPDRWDRFKRVVTERIAGLERQQRVRDRLAEVFQELIGLVEGGDPTPPTQADLVRLLGVPRETISADFRLLREVISEILPQNSDS